MNLITRIQAFSQKHSLLKPGSTIIVGLSGGPDSVFLLKALLELSGPAKITLIAAHLDHEWRSGSSKDAQFCQDLCDRLGIKLYTRKISQLGTLLNFNGSKEELARKYRRYFFEHVKKETNASKIALAHHADDQEETFFIRLMRGASLAGLTGMKPLQGEYIRPLLGIYKTEILEYLAAHSICYVVDPTNSSENYLRNRIRMIGIPALKNCDARFSDNFARTLEQLQATQAFLDTLTAATYARITNGTKALNIALFANLDDVIKDWILIHWLIDHKVPFTPSQGLLQELKRFFQSSKGNTHKVNNSWTLEKKNEFMTLIKKPENDTVYLEHTIKEESSGFNCIIYTESKNSVYK